MAEQKGLTDIEREAAVSYREWPIYIVLRMKRLEEIQKALRVVGNRTSQRIRREELLKAAYDLEEDAPVPVEDPVAPDPPAAASPARAASPAAAAPTSARDVVLRDSDDDYYEDVMYDDD